MSQQSENSVLNLYSAALQHRLSRRQLLERAAQLGMAAAGVQALLACGSSAPATASNNPGERPDLAKAKQEGTLTVWCGDQEDLVVEFLKSFTDKTGIAAQEVHILPGAGLPKLEAELSAGQTDVDVWMISDVGILEQLRKQGHLLRYSSPELSGFDSKYKSNPLGYWTAYTIDAPAIMYDPRYLRDQDAPQTYEALLDGRWKGQLGFQNSSSGDQYAWWYILKDLLPSNYWDQLASQLPRAFSSTTQIIQEVHSGDLKVGAKVGVFQYVLALRKQQPTKMILPKMGLPSTAESAGIIAVTSRPNASKAFIDYLLSAEGQQKWSTINGLYSPRPEVTIPELPPLSSVKILLPSNLDDYSSPANHQKFVSLWNHIVGLS
jgi:iron(III) transport system substrate-binding protein